jgi:hypothetical protein
MTDPCMFIIIVLRVVCFRILLPPSSKCSAVPDTMFRMRLKPAHKSRIKRMGMEVGMGKQLASPCKMESSMRRGSRSPEVALGGLGLPLVY